jgi:hypothetical protein
MRRSRKEDEFEVRDVAARLAELLEKAVTLLTFSPRNQAREKVEKLVSPNDPARGRRAVDALIEAALVTEDERGRLCRAGDAAWH